MYKMTKVATLVCCLLYRLLLPAVLLVCAAVRFNAVSFVYAIFLLLSPLLSSPTPSTIRGGTGIYLRIVFSVGLLATLAHAIFHITLSAIATDSKPYGSMLSNCSANERLSRQILVERLDNIATVDIIRLVLPDVAVFLTGLLVYVLCIKLLPDNRKKSQEDLPTSVKSQRCRTVNSVLDFIGESILVILLAASGIIVPSVLSAIYFLSFLCLATIWSLYGHLGRKFNVFRILLLFYSAAHILVIHLYQFQFFQAELHPNDFIARLLGLTAVVITNCASPSQIFFYDSSEWPNFVNPAVLVILYYTLAFEVRRNWHRRVVILNDVAGEQTGGKRYRGSRRKGSERQVATSLDESQKEHLVEAEVQDYSSMEPVAVDRSGSPSMLTPDEGEQAGDEVDRPDRKSSGKRSPWVSALIYIMGQSYVLSLIAMMAWSITFHSWLTFVLLIAACCIWMSPNSRRVCYILSPFILFYGICLLTIQFIYGMNFTDGELPKESSGVNLEEVGLKKFPYPCLQLALQVLYTLMFWLTLRQYIRERRQSVLADAEKYQLQPVTGEATTPTTPRSISEMLRFGLDSPDGYDSNTVIWLGQYVWCLLCKYWILVCAAMLLVISLQEVVVYRIIYMILFLAFVLTFQYAYRLWRVTMFLFWWVIIIYSMIVLIILYTYQFENVADQWKKSTKLSNETLADIGLEKFDTAGLFIRLLTPTSFLIFIIIQVHYFHKPFLQISDLNRYKNGDVEGPATPTPAVSSPDATDTVCGEDGKKRKSFRRKFAQQFWKLWQCASNAWETLTWFLWRMAEIHVFKVVAFVVIMVTTYEVTAASAVYVILLSVFLPLTGCQFLFSHIAQFWTALVILSKMIYQLGLVDNSKWLSNCTGNSSQEPPFSREIDNAPWVGLMKTSDLAYYLRNYIGILLILAFERIVVYHQTQYYNKPDVQKPKTGIVFSDIKRQQADEGILPCLKYFLNYFFYKFGLEMCYIVSAITVSVRLDSVAVLYVIFLGILLLLSRRCNARVWPVYTIILVVLLPVQFLSSLGLPLWVCYKYPWNGGFTMLNSRQGQELEMWLYLPDYLIPPNSFKLIADFFQLLFVCLQWRVFRQEMKSHIDEPDGGNNDDITPEVEARMEIPVEDFTTKITSYLDVIKNFVFGYMFWVTLAIVFIAGTNRINLFSMGYVIAVFCFMWFGQEFLIKPLRKLVRAWNFLLGYCFFVLLLKAALQLPGCVFSKTITDNACWLVQLLGLTCLRRGYVMVSSLSPAATCVVEEDNTGLAWDVVCFTFLLLQRRIYTCHYFRHVVADIEAQNRLASRGCQLINRILMKEVAKQKEEELQILMNIKKKMNKLKEKQSKLKTNYVEPVEHFQAIRSGDYYLFEESEDEDVEETDELTTLTFGTEKDRDEDAGPSPLKVISTAVTSGTDEATKQVEDAEKEKAGSEPSSPKTIEPPAETGDEEEEEKAGVVEKIKKVFSFILAFLVSCANWLASLFNRISRNYRLVASKMKDDHIRVKQQIQMEHSRLIEEPVELKEKKPLAAEGDQGATTDDEIVVVTTEPVKIDDPVPQKSEVSLSAVDLELFDETEEEFEKNQPCLYRLLVATYFAIVARSEVVCYFLMILNHILSASLLSLPLPMFVFLWGMLSVPRPTKTFWVTVITYTEAVVVVKYLFQFGFFPWNGKIPSTDPFWPPNIIGVQQKDNFAVMDLILLLALFIHRTILKRYGLWKDEEEDDEEEVKKSSKSSSKSSIEKDEADGDKQKTDQNAAATGSQSDIQNSLEEAETEKEETEKPSPLKALVAPFIKFYKQLTCPDYSATTDVYAPMFVCDFINFLIIVFGYTAFGPSQTTSGGDVTSYISDNRIPVPFLIMLLAQFILIIIDRALYLKKNVLGKFLFQILLVVLLHIWMFFILPYSTKKPFFSNRPAQLWYFIKCVYFALSAYQIRSAYPTRILGNFLTKKYNYINLFLFKGFLAIPFLLELRTLMDWIWTNTTMAIGSWLQMEDIYANIYVLKCSRVIEKTHPIPRATPKRALIKYVVGGLLLFIIIFIIWFPLVLFSFANTVYEAHPPKECTVSVAFAGYQPIFTILGQQQNIRGLTGGEFKDMQENYNTDAMATSFLSNYNAEDVTRIQLDGKSTSVWTISPPSLRSLISDLTNASVTVNLDFYATFSREPNSQAGETLTIQYRKPLTESEKKQTAEMIVQNATNHVDIGYVFPEYIRLANKEATHIVALLGTPAKNHFTNISIYLDSTTGNTTEEDSWWDIKDLGKGHKDYLTFVTFNERVAPAGISAITGYGIIGLYVTFILLIGRMLRISTTGMAATISFRELPNVDNIMRLCLDLYLVREMQEWRLEEDLYAKLIFVYRSAETRVKWTRLHQSDIDETKKYL